MCQLSSFFPLTCSKFCALKLRQNRVKLVEQGWKNFTLLQEHQLSEVTKARVGVANRLVVAGEVKPNRHYARSVLFLLIRHNTPQKVCHPLHSQSSSPSPPRGGKARDSFLRGCRRMGSSTAKSLRVASKSSLHLASSPPLSLSPASTHRIDGTTESPRLTRHSIRLTIWH